MDIKNQSIHIYEPDQYKEINCHVIENHLEDEQIHEFKKCQKSSDIDYINILRVDNHSINNLLTCNYCQEKFDNKNIIETI